MSTHFRSKYTSDKRKATQIWAKSANVGEHPFNALVDLGPNLANIGQNLANVGPQIWSTSERVWSTSSHEFRQFGQAWPTSAQIWWASAPKLADFDPQVSEPKPSRPPTTRQLSAASVPASFRKDAPSLRKDYFATWRTHPGALLPLGLRLPSAQSGRVRAPPRPDLDAIQDVALPAGPEHRHLRTSAALNRGAEWAATPCACAQLVGPGAEAQTHMPAKAFRRTASMKPRELIRNNPDQPS